jgi:hypothetical protein
MKNEKDILIDVNKTINDIIHIISIKQQNHVNTDNSKLLYNKNIVEDKLNNICNHEWVDDYIDIDPDRSQKITYCRLCEVTKNF